jgi:hypothetical protein
MEIGIHFLLLKIFGPFQSLRKILVDLMFKK